MPRSPFSEELSSWIKSFQEIFLLFPGHVFLNLNSRKWERRKEFSPRNSPCSTCSPFSWRQHFHFLQIFLCAAPERANYTEFSHLAEWKGSCWQRRGNTKFFSWGSGEHRDDVLLEFLGWIHFWVSWNHLWTKKILFRTKMHLKHDWQLKVLIRVSQEIILVWKKPHPDPRSGIGIGAVTS